MNSRRAQRGLSLIELVIAIGIGLVLIASVIQVFMGSRHTFSVIEQSAQTEETAHYAKQFIDTAIMSAGYRAEPVYIPTAGISENSVDFKTVFPACAADGFVTAGEIIAPYVNVKGGLLEGLLANQAPNTDVLLMRFESNRENKYIFDCLGNSVHETNSSPDPIGWVNLVTQVLYVNQTTQPDGRIKRSLMCRVTKYSPYNPATSCGGGSVGIPQPLMDGIKTFTVKYGIDNVDDGKRDADQYLAANDPLLTPTLRKDIVSVRYDLTIEPESVLETTGTDGKVLSKGPAPIEHSYSQVVQMRNRPVDYP
jgi:hypothetical protein